jgi:predicted nucleic acid-binding protein
LNLVYVDTSALLALLIANDVRHKEAVRTFRALQARRAPLVTTSYVLVETYALLDRRVGRDATRRFREGFEPLLDVTWVQRDQHEAGLDLLLESARSASLVDAVSFVVARKLGIAEVFAYDRNFTDAGFRQAKDRPADQE